MTGKFQEGRHTIRLLAMSLLTSRINPALNPCQLSNLNAKCFYKNFLPFRYLLDGFFFWTCSFLWNLICLCLMLLQFLNLRFSPICPILWLNYGFHTYRVIHAYLCFSASKDFRILRDIAETCWFHFLQSEVFTDLEWYLLIFREQGYESWVNPTLALTLTVLWFWTRHFVFLCQFLFL